MRARAIGLLGLLAGCGDKEADTGAAEDSGGGGSAVCGAPGDTFSEGMSAACSSGTCSVSLLTASPGPPEKGDNVWQVVAKQDQMVLELSAVDFEPYMVEHEHGTTPATFSGTVDAATGVWTSDPMDFFMAGLWQVTVHTVDANEGTDAAVFTFCVEG